VVLPLLVGSVTACRQAVAAGLVPAYLSYSGTPLNLCGLQNPQVIEQLRKSFRE